MANTVVIGMQWGDEGKGKIVDLVSPAFDVVVRYQGGHNAGHTVKYGDRHFALHLVPSGILREGMRCVLGHGMVVSPEAFFEELGMLEREGVRVDGRLFISDRAQVILPHYAQLDMHREEAMGEGRIGTTSRGIGPAYELKVSRYGLRMADLLSDGLEARLSQQRARLAAEIDRFGAAVAEAVPALGELRRWGERLAPYVRDTSVLLEEWMRDGASILLEGAQGTLLDVDLGSYPFVTSSTTIAAGAAGGSGIAPTRLDGVVGVLKAYTTRVGEGPFPTELSDQTGERLRERGHEFGTTTGRPRRCGWLDLVAARYACRVNGVDSIALTKLDVLDGFDTIKVCVSYRIDGEDVVDLPADTWALARARPVYEELPGWSGTTAGALDDAALPEGARRYVRYVEEAVGAAVGIVSTGPRREETIVRNEPRLIELTGGLLEPS